MATKKDLNNVLKILNGMEDYLSSKDVLKLTEKIDELKTMKKITRKTYDLIYEIELILEDAFADMYGDMLVNELDVEGNVYYERMIINGSGICSWFLLK